MINSSLYHCHKDVQQALREGGPVVALESTIFCHGLPYPKNLETAIQMENKVREGGAVPAHIAIMGGRIRVGLSHDEIEMLCKASGVLKVSRNDLPYALSKGLHAATTVASTLFIASYSAIRVFATGGIGGVHRGVANHLDISADLQELSQSNAIVVSAGAKAILDIPKTLEYLETMGVPVIGYRTDYFPAFYSVSSGLKLSLRLDSAAEIASFSKAKWECGLDGAVLVANPVPGYAAIDQDRVEGFVHRALEEAERAEVCGKALTPFLLSYLNRETSGEAVDTNIELALNNAAIGASIACEYASKS